MISRVDQRAQELPLTQTLMMTKESKANLWLSFQWIFLGKISTSTILAQMELALIPGSHETSNFRILSAEDEPFNHFKFEKRDSSKPKKKKKKKKDYI